MLVCVKTYSLKQVLNHWNLWNELLQQEILLIEKLIHISVKLNRSSQKLYKTIDRWKIWNEVSTQKFSDAYCKQFPYFVDIYK